jgi:hypothetical protein
MVNRNRFRKPKPQATETICLWLGCGKKLKDYEAVYSEYCFTHSRLIKENEKKQFPKIDNR